MAPPAAAASGAAPAGSGGSAGPPSATAAAATAALCDPEAGTARRGQGSLDVYCIRHGTALHNVAFDTHRSRDVFFSDQCRDSPLMRKGHQEAQARGRSWKASPADPEYAKFAPQSSSITVDVKSTISLVYVSPLTRTLMTLSNIWKDEIVSVFGEGRNEAGKFPAAWGAEDCDLAGNIWEWAVGLTVVHSVPKEELLAGYRKKRELLSERHNVRFVALEELREYAMGMAANSRQLAPRKTHLMKGRDENGDRDRTTNKNQDRSVLELWFPWVDFSLIPETDEIFDRTVDVEANRKKGGSELIEYELGREKPTQYEELAQKHGFTWKTPNQKNKLSTGSGSGSMTTSFLIEDVPHVAHRIRDLKRFLLQTHVANVAGGKNSTNTSRGGRIALVSHSGFLGQMMFNAFWRNGERMTQLEHCYPYEYQVRAEDLDTLWGPDVEDEDRKVKIINPFVDANANRES
eukprot:g5476.t1